jgi:F0F1-type ATP synthase assembly protein I
VHSNSGVKPGEETPLRARVRRSIMAVVAAQLGAALVVALALTLSVDVSAGYSALVGALVGVTPNFYFARRLLGSRSRSPQEELRRVYAGELIKIGFTLALFVIAIVLLRAQWPVVFGTYLVVVLMNWLMFRIINLGERSDPGD